MRQTEPYKLHHGLRDFPGKLDFRVRRLFERTPNSVENDCLVLPHGLPRDGSWLWTGRITWEGRVVVSHGSRIALYTAAHPKPIYDVTGQYFEYEVFPDGRVDTTLVFTPEKDRSIDHYF